MSKSSLIIGATSAIATEVARLMASRGDRIYLMARNHKKLEALAAELGSQVVGFEAGDLNEVQANPARVQAAIDLLGPIDQVLIAHGYLGDQILSESDWPEAERILATNLASPISLLIPLAHHMQAKGSGDLGVITSVAGERGRPRNFTYGAAKGGLTRYLQGLRSRLYGSGVHVLNIKLGPADTPMTKDHKKTALFGEPKKLAPPILRALGSRRHTVYLKRSWSPIMALVRILPEPIFQRFAFLSGR